jgi:hypothetical protein
VEGLPAKPASETTSGRQEQLVVNNASMHRLASHELEQSRSAVETLLASLVA